MEIIVINYLVGLIAGILLIWWTGDKAVEASSQVSYFYGLSTFFIGFVLMAVATGLPELAVTITSVFKDASGLAAGDIIGSNFSDIALVLGIPALTCSAIQVFKSEFNNLMLMLFVTLIVMATVFVIGTLTPIHGVLLILLYCACLWILWSSRSAKKVIKEGAEAAEEIKGTKVGAITKLILSLIGLLIASELSVKSAIALATKFRLPLESVGATIFAVGTSLPELSVSISAIRKRDYSLALGNALGSVLEQGTLILGLLAIISRKHVRLEPLRYIAPFMFAAFGIIGYGILKHRHINRLEGIALVSLYAGFILYHYIIPAIPALNGL